MKRNACLQVFLYPEHGDKMQSEQEVLEIELLWEIDRKYLTEADYVS